MTIVKNHSVQHWGTSYHWMDCDYEIHSCKIENVISLWTLSMKMGIDLEEASLDIVVTSTEPMNIRWCPSFCLFGIWWSVVGGMGRKSLKPTERMCMAYGMVEGVRDGWSVLQGR